MYDLEYLPIARQDMIEIARYIGQELNNSAAAATLAEELIGAAENARSFPYAAPSYTPIRRMKREYRKLLVRNYFMFYWVDEEKHLITVARVIYAKRDFTSMLE